jgi:predicted amidohydrolase YtcJ
MKIGTGAGGIVAFAAFLLVASLAFARSGKLPPADLLIVHGKVYTVNAKQPWVQAVAMRAGKIVAVGEDAEIEKLRGPDRAGRAWAWKSIASAGGHLAFGSDWPVVTLNPSEGVETAVTRQTSEGQPHAGFVPEQRLTIAETIRGYTLGAAYAGRREKTEGSIEAGKLADLIILSQNLFEVDAHRVAETKIVTTIVGGRVVHQTPAN